MPETRHLPAKDRSLLNVMLVLGILDLILLVILLALVATVDKPDREGFVSVAGPVHGFGYLLLIALSLWGWQKRGWPWWAPFVTFITGGPGSIIVDLLLRRGLRRTTSV